MNKQQSVFDEIQGPLALVQFLAIKDQDAFYHYRSASERAVIEAEGQRTHYVHIDQYLAGGEMHYQAITVDQLPSNDAVKNVFDAVYTERKVALSDIYALAVRLSDRLPRVVKALGFLSPVLSRILGTNAEKEMTGFREIANPETGPVPETLAELRKHDQTTPFYMMNLNRYYPKAQYDNGEELSGVQAYNRYGSWILPYLVSVGGYPDIIGQVVATLVGDEASPLYDDWNDFAMVHYPSRLNFIHMMTNSPKKGIYHRDAGLQRAILMPSSNF